MPVDVTSAGMTRAYAGALAAPDPDATCALLAAGAVFRSPYSTFDTGTGIRRAFQARSRAFAGLRVRAAVAGDGRAFVLWEAASGPDGARVEGVDVLGLAGGAISTVDVFLRPAEVLPVVLAAMTAAWPGP